MTYRRILAGALIFLTGRGVSAIAYALSIFFLLRALNPSAYGHFSLSFAAINLFAALSSVWASQAVLRYGTTDILCSPRAVGLSFVACVPGGMAAVAAHLVYGWQAVLPWSITVSLLAGIATSFFVVAAILQAALQVRETFAKAVLVDVLRASGMLFGSVALYLFSILFGNEITLVHAVLLLVVSNCVSASYALFCFGLRLRRFDLPRRTLMISLRFGFPMTLWMSAFQSIPVLDRSFITLVSGSEQAGHYAVIFDLVTRALYFAMFPFIWVAHPKLMRAASSGAVDEFRRIFWAGSSLLVASAAGAVIAAYWFSGLVLAIFLADGFLPDYVFVATLVALAGALWNVAMMIQKPLEASERTGLLAVSMLGWIGVYAVGLPFAIGSGGLAPVALLNASVAAGYLTTIALACRIRGLTRVRATPADGT